MTRGEDGRPKPTPAAAVLVLLGLVSLSSHLSGAIPGGTYYFRDLGMSFIPARLFWVHELREGRWPFWNPFVQEGVAAFPMAYPPDWLHLLWPSPAFVSWLLVLHFPLAALCAYGLARELGMTRRGAFVSGAAYALGGLAVASLNLYLFLQALALTPLVTYSLLRAARGSGRAVAVAALVLGVALTTSQEFVVQGFVLGLSLGFLSAAGMRRPAALRLSLATILGIALAAVPVAVIGAVLPETVRGAGLPPALTLQYSFHPAALMQVLIRDFFGSLTSPLEVWWGHRFFTHGFPYFLSFYLGPQVLALAATGVFGVEPRRRSLLLVLAGLAIWYGFGTHAGLAPWTASLPFFRSFRYPSKALLLPYLVACLFAGAGMDRLRAGAGWGAYRRAVLVAAGLAAATAALALFATAPLADWMESDPVGNPILRVVLATDGLQVAALALAGFGLALAVKRGVVGSEMAAAAIAALLVLDLARSGAGIDQQTSTVFFQPLPEIKALGLSELGGGRVFTYGTENSPAFNAFVGRRERGGLLWGSFVKRQMLMPNVNLMDRVETAPSDDVGAFVFVPSELGPEDYDPQRIADVLPRLRRYAISRVLSLDPLVHPDLRLLARVPAGPVGLNIHVYDLAGAWPRAYVACRVIVAPDRRAATTRVRLDDLDPARDVVLESPGTADCSEGRVERKRVVPGDERYDVQVEGAGYLVMRDSYARGWRAWVDGGEVPVVRADGRHRAVAVTTGRHEVVLKYQPPGLRAGLVTMAAGLVALLVLWVRPELAGNAGPVARLL